VKRLAIRCLVAGLLTAGCQFPADPDGTLERVEGETMRLGVTEHDPWVRLDGTRPAGVEVTLAERFAESLGARVEYTQGAEAELIDALKAGELDLVVGGFDSKTPWKKEAGLTRPYLQTREPVEGEVSTVKHVMLAPLGENAWLVRLERFLLEREMDAQRLLIAEGGP
jgi:ABC-type amino acid transport substrate-binding protein